MGRPFFAPPDVPRARVEALRKAFSTTMIDSAFLEDARKTGLDIDLVTGAEVDDILARAYALSPIIVAQAKELLDEK
jgi:tripartite-type tricarboxylate transporter receptor subunit TctC